MVTWQDLVRYVRSNYKISDENKYSIKLVFETSELRSQLVFLWHQLLVDRTEEWVQIESPVGPAESVDLRKALDAMGHRVCGGLAIVNDFLMVRHTVPLLNLNLNEFERPLLLVTTTADDLEQELVGGDRF